MKLLSKLFKFFFTIYGLLLFIFFLLIIFPLVIIASFFGRIRGGNFIYKLCSLWGDVWLPLVGIFHKNIFVAPHSADHAVIFVANHVSYMDVPILVKTLRQPIRVLGKIELSKIPVFGFLYRKAVVMVDRSSNENRATSVKTLKSVLRRNISIVIFPEGTFNESSQPLQAFYNGAFRIAIETQTPIKPIVFPDTIDRLHYGDFFSLTPGISRAIFMEEISVEGLTIKDLEQLKNKVHEAMSMELRKYHYYEQPKIITKTSTKNS